MGTGYWLDPPTGSWWRERTDTTPNRAVWIEKGYEQSGQEDWEMASAAMYAADRLAFTYGAAAADAEPEPTTALRHVQTVAIFATRAAYRAGYVPHVINMEVLAPGIDPYPGRYEYFFTAYVARYVRRAVRGTGIEERSSDPSKSTSKLRC